MKEKEGSFRRGKGLAFFLGFLHSQMMTYPGFFLSLMYSESVIVVLFLILKLLQRQLATVSALYEFMIK